MLTLVGRGHGLGREARGHALASTLAGRARSVVAMDMEMRLAVYAGLGVMGELRGLGGVSGTYGRPGCALSALMSDAASSWVSEFRRVAVSRCCRDRSEAFIANRRCNPRVIVRRSRLNLPELTIKCRRSCCGS